MSIEMALRGARVGYGPLEALHGLDLPVPAGAVTLLLGRNGAGRTTALRALAGSVRLTAGAVYWRGAEVTRLRAHERARRGLRFVPAERAVHEGLSVRENLQLAAGQDGFAVALDAYPALEPLLGRTAGTLSGGEQRMLALSRALLAPAGAVLLLDEPVTGLSAELARRTYELLAARAGSGAAVVVAEQRLPPVLARPGVIVHELRRGAIVFSGEAVEPARPGAAG